MAVNASRCSSLTDDPFTVMQSQPSKFRRRTLERLSRLSIYTFSACLLDLVQTRRPFSWNYNDPTRYASFWRFRCPNH